MGFYFQSQETGTGKHRVQANPDFLDAVASKLGSQKEGGAVMGFYYDWVNDRWQEKSTNGRRHRRIRAWRTLLPALVDEIENGDSEGKLYAGLLARHIVTNDEILMEDHGKRVAKLTGEKAP